MQVEVKKLEVTFAITAKEKLQAKELIRLGLSEVRYVHNEHDALQNN